MSIFNTLKTSKNLLGFSGGVDSSALFFMLLEKNISFDIAIVDYNQREQSKDEMLYAKELAKKYNKQIFTTSFSGKFSEKIARDFRYNFFEDIIKKHNYSCLILAHQLNDKCEWFMMQFCKGAGLKELFGMNEIEYRKDYFIVRPLLKNSKKSILNYLKENKIDYFIDESNLDEKYKRNYFRLNFCDKLIDEYEDGIRKSFLFLEQEIRLIKSLYEIKKIDDIFIIKFKIDNDTLKIMAIDEVLKKEFNILLSYKSKLEILKTRDLVISHKVIVSFYKDKIFISQTKDKIKMDKKFKEFCRINKIPKLLRPILFNKNLKMLISTF